MTSPTSFKPGPLAGLRVIELGTLLAGPFCGQLLGDFGAEVIKVEPPGQGDPMRVWGREKAHGKSLWWPVVARNKKAITLDLRQADGQALLKDLVKQSDFLLENFRPGTMEKWGLGWSELSAINPRLIMIRVSGFGQTGPYSRQAGFGAIGEAMGGLRYVVGDPSTPPSRMGISIGDSLAATFACIGALSALHHRDKTGRGQVVDSAIYEAVLNMMESLITEYDKAGYVRERTGAILPNVAPSNVYRTADGMVLIAANQDTVFSRLAEAMGQPDLATNPKYSSHGARGAHQAELDALVESWTSTLTTACRARCHGPVRRARRADLPGAGHARRPALQGARCDRQRPAPGLRRAAHAERRAEALGDTRGACAARARRSASTTTRSTCACSACRPSATPSSRPPRSSEHAA